MSQDKPPLDPHPLSEYVAWAGNRNREPLLGVLKEKLPKDPGKCFGTRQRQRHAYQLFCAAFRAFAFSSFR